MLKHTFCHIPGLGVKTERRLWDSGLLDWDALVRNRPKLRKNVADPEIFLNESKRRLKENDAPFFSQNLPAEEAWRLFGDFGQNAAYFDIETNGLAGDSLAITAIALYDGKTIRHYIKGFNLDEFIKDIFTFSLLVTFNGKSFDVPIVERHFNAKLPHAHIDLMHVLRRLGYKGGLKKCEKVFGIDRGALAGLDGYSAVILWREHMRGNPGALKTLLAYNALDAVNLKTLMVKAYNLCLESTPFASDVQLRRQDHAIELDLDWDASTLLLALKQTTIGRGLIATP